MTEESSEYDAAKCNFCDNIFQVSEMFVKKRPQTSKVKLKEIFWCVKCYNDYELKKAIKKPPIKF